MPTHTQRAGLMLGAIGILCAFQAQAQDFRPTQALLESGLFLSLSEVDAAYARLDADRAAATAPIPKAMTYWESGGAGFGQSDRSGRIGSGGSSTQMRIGMDREVRDGLVVGAMAAGGVGSVGSGDLGAQIMGVHADVYAKASHGPMFVKMLAGASQYDLNSIVRGAVDQQCRADAANYVVRAGGQVGGTVQVAGVSLTPTVGVTALGDRLSGYSETGGENAASFGARTAAAAIAAVRLTGRKAVRLDPRRKLNVEAFVGAEEVVGFKATDIKATVAGMRIQNAAMGSPTGRGVVGGLGVGTALMDGVTVQLNYDYGLRDGVSTRSTRGRLGIAF